MYTSLVGVVGVLNKKMKMIMSLFFLFSAIQLFNFYRFYNTQKALNFTNWCVYSLGFFRGIRYYNAFTFNFYF